MALTYATFVSSLANFLVVPAADASFLAAVANIIDDAELRAYRDLDLLNTVFRDASNSLVAGNRNFTEPSSGNGPFVVTENFNVITPAGTTNPDLGTRNPLMPTTKELLDFLYPSVAGAGVPQYFAPITQNTFIVGPWPDANYTIEVVGTQRPSPLTAINPTTILTIYFPDLFLDAGLAMGAGYLKNFGAMQDDPQSGVTWESKYKTTLASAKVEEARKRFTSEGWSPAQPTPLATPPRT